MKQVLLAFAILVIVIIANLFVFSGMSPKSADLELGKEKDLSLLAQNIKWDPDGHISYIAFKDGSRRYFISGNQRTYAIDAPKSISLIDAITQKYPIKEVLGPDKRVTYKNFYATIGSVLQTDPKNLYHVVAFAQYEEQAVKTGGDNDYANFTSSIGMLESTDGGNTWKDFGPAIRGDDYLPPGTRITGAGQPCAIIKDGYIYIYFVSWASGRKVSHADEIFLARAKIQPDGSVEKTFEYLNTNGSFSQTITGLKPVITIPENTNAGYASLPSISYNKYLNKYFAVFETNIGLYSATSVDGISWGDKKQIFAFKKPQSERKLGDEWISYPSFLSDANESTDQTTNISGNLYYGKGIWPNTSHQLTVKPFRFKGGAINLFPR